jgi:hypothetical protein
MRITDWLMIVAVLLAPLVAVQVQKILERYREDRERKLNVFKTLMASRLNRAVAELTLDKLILNEALKGTY